MTLTKIALTRLQELREAQNELKHANKERSTKRDLLIEALIIDAVDLYVTNKDNFPTYNGFIKAYEAELLSHCNEDEKALIGTISIVSFALKNGLSKAVKYGTIGKIFKYQNFVPFSALKKASDKKAVNAIINQAKKDYEDAITAKYETLVKTLENKSIEELSEIREVISLVNAKRKAKK